MASRFATHLGEGGAPEWATQEGANLSADRIVRCAAFTRNRRARCAIAHGAAMFPTLGQSTGELPLRSVEEPAEYREVMMPRRKQTREQNRRDRITAERRQRSELIAEEERQRQAWLAATYQAPPF